jgi:hypothetical protein
MTLPAHASEASRKRYEIAVRLAESCPPELGDEIALTGSTSAGLADDDSDLELNLWAETIPPAEARVAWLRAAGVDEIQVFEQPRPDDSYWVGGRVGDVPLEVGWQTLATAQANVQKLLSGSMSQVMAYILANAIPFRSAGYLLDWQAQLQAYSDTVQAQTIQQALALWSKSGHMEMALRVARRGERLAVTEIVLGDLKEMMALLYAVNRRWQPSRKWTFAASRDFTLMPERWRERIDEALAAQPEEGVRLCAELLLDALALVPPPYDVSEAVKVVGAFADGEE